MADDSGGYSVFDSVFNNPLIKGILGPGTGGATGQTPPPPNAAPPMPPVQDFNTPPPMPAPNMNPTAQGVAMAPPGAMPEPGLPSGPNGPMGFGGGSSTQQPTLPLPPTQQGLTPGMLAQSNTPGQGGLPPAPATPFGPRAPLPPPPIGPPPLAGAPPGGTVGAGVTPGPSNPAVPGLMSSLASALGVNTPEGKQAMMAGLAKGMSAIQGPGRFASFARGAGLGAGGTIAQQDKQEAQDLAKQHLDLQRQQLAQQKLNQNFNQLSTAFRDVQYGKSTDATLLYRQTQLDVLRNGGAAGRALLNTPYGRQLKADDDVAKFREREYKDLDTSNVYKNAEGPERKRMQAERDKRIADFQENLYKQRGIDPKDAQNYQLMGKDAQHPFDTVEMKMNKEHFDLTVPMGGFYKAKANKDDPNGAYKTGDVITFQRTTPPVAGSTAIPTAEQPIPGATRTETHYPRTSELESEEEGAAVARA